MRPRIRMRVLSLRLVHDTLREIVRGRLLRLPRFLSEWPVSYLLGVDGGNSKTLAALADDSGRVLGVGGAGNSNHQAVSLAPALRQISLAVEAALRHAGIDASDVQVAYYALAGADFPDDFALLEPALSSLGHGQHVGVNNDTIAALRAGTDNPNAVVVILGAGTNAAGRAVAEREIRLPGLGWYSGDWGGGAELGREAVRLVARANDGRGTPTALTDLLLEHFGRPTVDELILAIYRREIAFSQMTPLAPLVFRAAREGDAVASDLLRRMGEEVVVTATALLRRLNCLDVEADVVLAGSVYRGEGTVLLDAVRRGLERNAPLARAVVPEAPPVLGALFCAMDMAGVVVDDEVRGQALESYRTLMQEEVVAR